MGLLDFKVDVVLARVEADFSDQPPSIPAVPNHPVSLQCPTTMYPCSAQPLSILAVPNRKVSLQCPTAMYHCSAQLQSIRAVSNHQISLQGPTESIPAVPKRRVPLECPTAKYQCSCSEFAVLQGRELRGGRETLHFLCNDSFRVVMLEVNNLESLPGREPEQFWKFP